MKSAGAMIGGSPTVEGPLGRVADPSGPAPVKVAERRARPDVTSPSDDSDPCETTPLHLIIMAR